VAALDPDAAELDLDRLGEADPVDPSWRIKVGGSTRARSVSSPSAGSAQLQP